MRRSKGKVLGTAVVGVLATLLAACSGGSSGGETTQPTEAWQVSHEGQIPVYAAVSPEKVGLITDLANKFNESEEAKSLEKPAVIVPMPVSSGEATRLLKAGWPTDQTDKPQPTIWSPASTAWTSSVADSNGAALVPNPQSFATSPLVLAMPERMTTALGWPGKEISLQDIEQLCINPDGWGQFGGAAGTWGSFKLGKTNPYTSTSGLNMLLMQAYAASGKAAGLTSDDIAGAADFTKSLESCVIHYGDTTGNVLKRIYDRGQNGQSLNYVSAVAVEETSVINYNLGNPQSNAVAPGTTLTPPAEKLVAVYPSGGSLMSDNPLVVLGTSAPWVTEEQRVAATAFQKFALSDAAQSVLGDYGFRPADTTKKPTGLVSAQYGANPDLPKVVLEKPSVATVTAAQQQWLDARKPSSVLLVMDVSNSMGESAGNGRSRMVEAIEGAQATLGHFRPNDELGTWAFSSGIAGGLYDGEVAVLREVTPLGGDTENLKGQLGQLAPIGGTPLYDTISNAYTYMKDRIEPGRINAIVVLTDGEDYGSQLTLDSLLQQLKAPDESGDPNQVRVFPIAYGEANSQALTSIAAASGGQVFSASDPRKLGLVFQQVMNNF